MTDRRVPKEDGVRAKLYVCRTCGYEKLDHAPPKCPEHPSRAMKPKAQRSAPGADAV